MHRRSFLQLGVASALALAALPGQRLFAGTQAGALRFASAVTDSSGQHAITIAEASGREIFNIPVAERCHAGCMRPGSAQAVVFERRPGRHLYVIDLDAGQLTRQLHAGPEHHFYGHGVFSNDGSRLYATANHFTTGEGVMRVYDTRDYSLIADYPVGGMDPHEVRLHPDGNTLIIALGGIHTHPDYDRIKLNLDSMAPALVLMDRRTGAITQRHEPSHHQLSCHHLDVSSEGIVIAGYQFEGPVWEAPPLIARLDTRTGSFSEIELPEDLQAGMRNYTASVAISPGSPFAAVSAPRGNQVVLLDYLTGALLHIVEIPDVAGILAQDAAHFIATSGRGGVYLIDARSGQSARISNDGLRWDNHLSLLGA